MTLKDITKQPNGAPRHERLIAETVVMREHESAHLHTLVLEVSHQLVAMRFYRDKFDQSNGGTWLDSYTNRFDGIVGGMVNLKTELESLKTELDGLEFEIIETRHKNLQKVKKEKEQKHNEK